MKSEKKQASGFKGHDNAVLHVLSKTTHTHTKLLTDAQAHLEKKGGGRGRKKPKTGPKT